MASKKERFRLEGWLQLTIIGPKLELSKELSIYTANSRALMMVSSLMKILTISLSSCLSASPLICPSINSSKLDSTLMSHPNQVPQADPAESFK
jgi:hypothetical protein